MFRLPEKWSHSVVSDSARPYAREPLAFQWPECYTWEIPFSLILIIQSVTTSYKFFPSIGSLIWRIPGTEEPGGLPSMGSHRVGHDWSNLAAAAAVSVQPVYYSTLTATRNTTVPVSQVFFLPSTNLFSSDLSKRQNCSHCSSPESVSVAYKST